VDEGDLDGDDDDARDGIVLEWMRVNPMVKA